MMQSMEEYFKLSETSSSNSKQEAPSTVSSAITASAPTADPSSQMMYQDLGNMSSENLRSIVPTMIPRRYGGVLSPVPESKTTPPIPIVEESLVSPVPPIEHHRSMSLAPGHIGSNRSVIESDRESVGTAVHSDYEEDF
jgi:hypothetical protein